jgi:HPt (histidine-containing phosphotransfer) domain-containing protein
VKAERAPRENSVKHLEPLDLEAVMARLNGDRDLLAELVGIYLEDEGSHLAALQSAVARGNAEEVRRAAHAIKGCVANFSAGPAQAAALALETAGREDDLANAAALLESLEGELGALRDALTRLGAVPKP